MKKFVFLQYFLVFIRNIFGIILIPLLDPQQLGIYKIFCNITNNSRFLHFGIPAISVFRSTAKGLSIVKSYEKLIFLANILSLILLLPYIVFFGVLYDLLDIYFAFALVFQTLAILINNILSALERIKGNLLLYSFSIFLPHVALMLSPFLYAFDHYTNFSIILLFYGVVNLIASSFVVYRRRSVIFLTFKNTVPKFNFILLAMRKSLLQIIFSLLFAANILLDNFLLLDGYSLAFLGSYSVYLVYNSLFSQFYSAFTVYTFKYRNNLYENANLRLIKFLILTALAALSISYLGSAIVIYILGFFPKYSVAADLIGRFWWLASLMIFRFNLPNYYFKNNLSFRLILIFLLGFILKLFLIFFVDYNLYTVVILFEPLLSLLILGDYLLTKKAKI